MNDRTVLKYRMSRPTSPNGISAVNTSKDQVGEIVPYNDFVKIISMASANNETLKKITANILNMSKIIALISRNENRDSTSTET